VSPSGWLPARVAAVTPATDHAVVLLLDVPGWPGNAPGQHLDVRLTAEDGYQAERAYSLASSGPGSRIEIAVQAIPDGQVSPYLAGVAEPGDAIEVNGPLGGYFVWREQEAAPVQLIAGGSGIVPLYAIARARDVAPSTAPFRLLYSVRSEADAIYRAEVTELGSRGLDVTWAFTRSAPPSWPGAVGRLDAARIAAATWAPALDPLIYVCGPTAFVESVATVLVAAGHRPLRIRTERFGG
jgi:ferredoxin-NADP reductase